MTTFDAQAPCWAISDGRAGNARQAGALAAAVGLPHASLALTPRAPWRWVAPWRMPLDAAAFGDAFGHALRTPPRLAIGCGRQAALATRLLGARGARTVQVLDPRLPPRCWDLVVAPEHDGLHGDNVVSLLGSLHPVDDAWLAAGRAAWAAFAALPTPRIALLVGGPSPHWRLDDAAFDAACAAVAARARALGGSVLATASRRTPAPWRASLRTRLRGLPGIAWIDGADGANPYAGLLGWADRIVATADSVNMLSEAAATHAPLEMLRPDSLRGRLRTFAEALEARGRAQRFERDAVPTAQDATPLRETARVAAMVRARLGIGGGARG